MSAEARPKPLLNVRELADLLGWKLRRTYEADRSGAIPGRVVVNGRILYRAAVVRAWLAGADVLPVAAEAGPVPLGHDAARRDGRAAGEGR